MKKIFGLVIVAAVLLVGCSKKEDKNAALAKEVEEAIEKAGVEREAALAEATKATEEPEDSAAPTPITEGKKLFEGKGACMACHQPNVKVIGPSLEEIAKIYKDKSADMVKFLKGEGEAIVDPAQFAVMEANLANTKKMSDEELKNIEAYIYSFL